MDPNANLNTQRDLAQRFIDAAHGKLDAIEHDAVAEGVELAEYVLALDAWRRGGGFDPYTSGDGPFSDYSPEAAARILGGNAEVWHSGGGIMLGRVTLDAEPRVDADEQPYLLISPAAEIDGESPGWYVGFYDGTADDDGSRGVFAADPGELRGAVKALQGFAAEVTG